jgi:ATP-dependent Clp protease ATP-binding subunit ClpC
VFDNFVAEAKRALSQSRKYALCFHHHYIGAEHLALGILTGPENAATAILGRMGIRAVEIANEIETAMMPGPIKMDLWSSLPFTKGAKRSLEATLCEAMNFGHSFVGTQHLLLGLFQSGEVWLTDTLRRKGVVEEVFRKLVGEPEAK